MINLEFVNKEEIVAAMTRLGKLPKVALNRSVKAGIQIAFSEIKSKVPARTGALKKGLKIVKEKPKSRGKASSQITFNRKMNDIFQKKSQWQSAREGNPSPHVQNAKMGEKQGGKKNAYYPSSVEYGYEHFYYGNHLGYRTGKYFMRDGLFSKQNAIRNEMGLTLAKDLQTRWLKG